MEEMNGQVFSSIKNELTALNKVQHGLKIFLFSFHVCAVYVCVCMHLSAVPVGTRRGHQLSGRWSYKWFKPPSMSAQI